MEAVRPKKKHKKKPKSVAPEKTEGEEHSSPGEPGTIALSGVTIELLEKRSFPLGCELCVFCCFPCFVDQFCTLVGARVAAANPGQVEDEVEPDKSVETPADSSRHGGNTEGSSQLQDSENISTKREPEITAVGDIESTSTNLETPARETGRRTSIATDESKTGVEGTVEISEAVDVTGTAKETSQGRTSAVREGGISSKDVAVDNERGSVELSAPDPCTAMQPEPSRADTGQSAVETLHSPESGSTFTPFFSDDLACTPVIRPSAEEKDEGDLLQQAKGGSLQSHDVRNRSSNTGEDFLASGIPTAPGAEETAPEPSEAVTTNFAPPTSDGGNMAEASTSSPVHFATCTEPTSDGGNMAEASASSPVHLATGTETPELECREGERQISTIREIASGNEGVESTRLYPNLESASRTSGNEMYTVCIRSTLCVWFLFVVGEGRGRGGRGEGAVADRLGGGGRGSMAIGLGGGWEGKGGRYFAGQADSKFRHQSRCLGIPTPLPFRAHPGPEPGPNPELNPGEAKVLFMPRNQNTWRSEFSHSQWPTHPMQLNIWFSTIQVLLPWWGSQAYSSLGNWVVQVLGIWHCVLC